MIKEIKLKRTKKLKKGNKRKNIKNHKLTKAGFQKSRAQTTEAGFQKSRAQTTEAGLQLLEKQDFKNPARKQQVEKAVPKQHLKISRTQTKGAQGTESNIKGGGNVNSKENFEVKRITDIDYSQFSLSKYLNADPDWGKSPGPPPTDCCVM